MNSSNMQIFPWSELHQENKKQRFKQQHGACKSLITKMAKKKQFFWNILNIFVMNKNQSTKNLIVIKN